MLIAGFPAGSFQANCYVLAPAAGGECLVVDPGEDAVDQLNQVLAEHHLTPTGVLLTHGHLDHVASAAAVCAQAGIPAYLHGADQYMLEEPLAALSADLQRMLAGYPIPDLRPEEVRGIDSDETLEIAGIRLTVDHTPGHTGGSVVYRLAAAGDRPEVIFTGDTLFAGSVGRSDLPGGSHEQLLDSIKARLLSRPDDAVLLPGHGPSSTIGSERAVNPFLADL